MTTEKKYLASFDTINGLELYSFKEGYTPSPSVRDWLEVPEEVIKKVEEEKSGNEIFYIFKDGCSSMDEGYDGDLESTERIMWDGDGWCYESLHRCDVDNFTNWEYNATFEEIIALLGGVNELTEDQKEWFRDEGENVD